MLELLKLTFICMLTAAMLALLTLSLFDLFKVKHNCNTNSDTNFFSKSPIRTILIEAFKEEFIFRFMIIFVYSMLVGMDLKSLSNDPVLDIISVVLMISSSIVFGYMHGDWKNIFIQGWFGVALFLLFYASAWTFRSYFPNSLNVMDSIIGLIFCTIIHTIHNIFSLLILPKLHEKYP